MERLIEIDWENESGSPCTGEAIVEYVRYDEDGKIVNEILNIFLPEEIGQYQAQFAKDIVTRNFHNGEGSNL